jgi:polar amino acid transport system substrate-binding protein
MAGRIKWTTLMLTLLAVVGTAALAGCAAEPADEPAAATDTEDALARVQDRGTLIVGTAPFYAPFESTNEQTKEIEGFDVDLMTEIASRMGVEVEFMPSEWQGLLGGLEKGDFDVIVSAMTEKEAAEGNVEFSQVYYDLPDVIIVASGNPKGIDAKGDLAGMVVGVQTGSGAEMLAEELDPEVGFTELRKYELTQDAMNDLKAGRIDAVIAGHAFAIEQSKVDPSFEVSDQPLETSGLVGVFKNGSGSLVDEFDTQLEAIKADGTYDALVKKWLTIE